MRFAIAILSLALMAGCGDDGEVEAPPDPPTPAAPEEGEGAPETSGEEPTPTAPPTTPTTPTAEGESSVETRAPEPATGCPANDVAAQLDRPGTVHRRNIEIDETLDLAGSPHRFERGITVSDGATLTLDPCALVLVGEGAAVTVSSGGMLVAEGTGEQPIRFDSEARDPAPGQWAGIHVMHGSRPATRFVHTIIEDAGGHRYGAAIWVDREVELDVRHVTIRYSSQHGVHLHHEGRFASDATDLTVTESGREDPYSAPVWFFSANQVRTLPDGTYTGNVSDEIWVENHEVRTNGTWRNPGVRYRLNEGISIGHETGPVLTIAPGTTLAFNQGQSLAVGFGDSGLVLDGESEETPITLTSARPHPAAGDWGGVRIGDDRADSVTKLNYVIIEHAGSETSHPYTTRERTSCRDTPAAALSIRDHDLGANVTNVTFRSLPEEAAAILANFRGEATDYTAAEHGNDFSEAGTECRQNLQPEGDCPDPACR